LPADLQNAIKILMAEAFDGCRDRKVIGGLAAFWRNFAATSSDPKVQEASVLLADYASLSPTDRSKRIKQVADMLSAAPTPRRAVAHIGEPVPAPNASERLPDVAAPPFPILTAVRERVSGGTPPYGITLDTPIQDLKGIGPVRARLYSRLGLKTIRDLLFHFPTRHIPYPPTTPIADLFFQGDGSVLGILERLEVENLPRGLKKLKATVRDATGTVQATWLRHGVARIGVTPGDPIALSGKLVQQGRHLFFDGPDYERGDGPPVHTRGLVPVHPLTAGLTDRELRFRIHWAIGHFAQTVTDPLPDVVRAAHNLPPIGQALRQMHFPATVDEAAHARRRFAFEELLTIQLVVLQRRLHAQQSPAAPLPRHELVLQAFERSLPFELTGAQRRVTDEILRDLERPEPMTRLLQGEVGSGKTAVAALALLTAAANGYQGALMAPTEILAEQHFATLSRLFAGASLADVLGREPVVTLLTGGVKGKERTRTYGAVASGAIDVLVGTQALIQDMLEFARLGLVVVDEQHRFGVRQRVRLRRRATEAVPHLLVMTATPIPRTLALSLYGDLDLSAIDEMPAGRQPTRTVLLGADERHLAYERVRRAAGNGEQAFVICPLVEESEALEAKAATEEYERLRAGELSALRLGLLHGRMKPAEKDATMRAFRDREFDVLVSTAVVEVGVDIPNATVMLIEGAERFGLAQLHQFRGRIGRGDRPSVCILLSDLPDPDTNERLAAVIETTNGLTLAEHDLRLRGPGDYFGVRQSGLPELKVARLDDAPLIEAARSAASAILADDPELTAEQHAALRAHLDDFVASAGEPS